MHRLPDPQQPTTTAGQPDINDRAQRFLADIEAAMATSYRDPTPVPTVGSTPPVAQPGRPP